MKKIRPVLYSFFLILLLSSCKNRQVSNDNETISTDSIVSENDKLKNEINDSLSKIAWGDAKFGMSKNEVSKTNAFKKGEISDFIAVSSDTRSKLIKTLRLSEPISINAFFKENELVKVVIESIKVSASHIDDLENDVNLFIHEFSKRYGNPVECLKNISISNFNEGKTFTYASYVINMKYISIDFGETYDGGEFYYKISINNWDYPQKKHTPNKEEIEETKKKEKEKKDIVKYSF